MQGGKKLSKGKGLARRFMNCLRNKKTRREKKRGFLERSKDLRGVLFCVFLCVFLTFQHLVSFLLLGNLGGVSKFVFSFSCVFLEKKKTALSSPLFSSVGPKSCFSFGVFVFVFGCKLRLTFGLIWTTAPPKNDPKSLDKPPYKRQPLSSKR